MEGWGVRFLVGGLVENFGGILLFCWLSVVTCGERNKQVGPLLEILG